MIHQIDATNQSLGRLASRIAIILRGKNLVSYAPNKLSNTEVVVKELKKVKFTGNKFSQKKYHHYSGYHSGIKTRSMAELWASKPEDVLKKMVYNMLPKNKMRDKIINNLRFL